MEFSEKLRELRSSKNLTQEQLAEGLYVSRTAISKWESGRGYPSLDSLREISRFFAISLDDLLSGEELLTAADEDSRQKLRRLKDKTFGLLDLAAVLFLFLPLFGKKSGSIVEAVSLPALPGEPLYLIIPYYVVVIATALFGVLSLALQDCSAPLWVNYRSRASMALSLAAIILFMLTLQPYAGVLALLFCIMKGLLLIKWE